MAFFKKKNEDKPEAISSPVEQVFKADPQKKPVKVYEPSKTVTPKPVVKQPTDFYRDPNPHALPHTFGYGPEEADGFDSYQVDFPQGSVAPPKYNGPATPLAPGEKPAPWYKTYTPKPLYEKRGIIFLVVEASEDTAEYQNEITRLINKIIADNQDEFFMFLRFGNDTKYSEHILGATLKDKDVAGKLLTIKPEAKNTFNLYAALKHIDTFMKDYLTYIKIFKAQEKEYVLEKARIIFIGSGKTDECVDNPRILLRTLCKNKKVAAVKYFCLKDKHAINAAAIGFPVIGHIESNFYK